MKIQIQAPELKSIIHGLSKIIPKKSLHILQGVRIIANEGHIQFQGCNLDQFVTGTIQSKVEQEGECILPFEALKRASKRIQERLEVVVEGQSARFRFPIGQVIIHEPVPILPLNDWPIEPVIHETAIPLDQSFKNAIAAALDCSSEDPTRQVLNGAFLDLHSKEGHYVVGTDGRHLFSANSFDFDLKESLIIPNQRFLTWGGFMDDGDWHLKFAPAKDQMGWIQINSEHWEFVTKEGIGQYPNYRQVIPTEFKSCVTLCEAGVEFLLNAIPRIPGAETQNSPITLTTSGDHVIIHGKGDGNWSSIPVIGASAKGKNSTITLNRNFLLKALKFGFSEMHIADQESPTLMFKDKGRVLVVMGIRQEENPPENKQDPFKEKLDQINIAMKQLVNDLEALNSLV